MNFEQQSMWNRLQGKPGNYYSEAAEPEREAFRQFMKGLLWDGPVLIEFEKKDGSVRVMNCTLNSTFGAVYKDKIVDFTFMENILYSKLFKEYFREEMDKNRDRGRGKRVSKIIDMFAQYK